MASVIDMYGRQLLFTYTNGLLTSLKTTEGTIINYSYAAYTAPLASGSALATVGYPTTPASGLTYQHADVTDTSLVTGLVDEDGNTYATWTYDYYGRGLSSQLAGGADATTVSYDDSGAGSGTVARTVTNALGVADLYTFTLLQNIPKVTGISRAATATTAAASRAFTYDANGYLASSTDWNGYLTSFTNDSRGDTLTEVDASGTSVARTTTTTWSTTLHLPTSVTTAGIATYYGYDSAGNVASRKDLSQTLSRIWSYVWNNALLSSVTGPRTDIKQVTSFTYASNGALASETDAAGHVTKITSSTQGGLPLTEVDPNGVTTKFTYDARQRLLTRALSTASGTLTTSFTYDAVGNLLKTQLPDGSYLANAYDPAHRLIMSGDAIKDTIAYTLDALGDRTTTIIGKSGGATTWSDSAGFDALGRKIVDKQGAGQTTTFTYDPQSQLLTTTDPLGRVTTQVPDPLGRISTITDPAKGVTRFTYDAHDRLLSETAPNGAVTANSYDGFGRLIRKISPDSGTTLYTYDLDDNLTQSQDASAVVINHSYDALDRILATIYPADTAENVAFTYDQAGHGFGVGRLTSLADAAGTAAYTYDERGNQLTQTRVSGTVTLKTTTTYDRASRVATITYPSGTLATYTHNTAGEVTALSTKLPGASTATTVVSGVTYDPFGPLTAMTYGNALAEARSYDLSYRLTKLVTGTVQSLTYSYDAADRATAIADGVNTGSSQKFGYDALDHLTSATGAYGTYGWTYDSAGNRLTQNAAGTSTTYSYTAHSNVLTKLVSGTTTSTVATSPAGNTLTVTPSSGSAVTRTYNKAERLAGVQIGGAQTATYTYDAFGQRFGKTLAASSSLFQYDQAGHLLEEAANTGALKTDTIYLNGAPIADVTPSALFFLHTDRLGTPQVATTTAGAVAWRAAYQAFGFNTGTAGLFNQNIRFPGQYADSETGDHQNGFRDYDPTLGRYLETDPIGLLGGINTFAYAGSSPTNSVDPSGRCPVCLIPLIEIGLDVAAELGAELAADSVAEGAAAAEASSAAAAEGTAASEGAAAEVAQEADGSFNVSNWDGYRSDLAPQPEGTLRNLPGSAKDAESEYGRAYRAGRRGAEAYRRANPSLCKGKDVHHIKPVKFGGSPTDPKNMTPLSQSDHQQLSKWWKGLQTYVEGQ